MSWPMYSADNQVIGNPFNKNSASFPVGFDPREEDISPQSGWTVYQRRIFERDKKPLSLQSGPWTFGQFGENVIPYFVLYNKYSAMMKVFAYLGDIDPVPGGRFVMSINSNGVGSTVLQLNSGVVPSSSKEFLATLPARTSGNGLWAVSTIKVAFDPSMWSRAEDIVITYRQLGSSEFQARGTFTGLACQDPSRCPDRTISERSFVSGLSKTVGQFGGALDAIPYKNIGNTMYWLSGKVPAGTWTPSALTPVIARDGEQINRSKIIGQIDGRYFPQYTTAGDVSQNLRNLGALFLDQKSGIPKVASILAAGVPYLQTALSLFGDGGTNPPPPMVLSLEGTIQLSGTVTSETYYARTADGISGSSYPGQFEKIPYHAKESSNQPIGHWSVSRKPKVIVVVSKGSPWFWYPEEARWNSDLAWVQKYPSVSDAIYSEMKARYTTNSDGSFKGWVYAATTYNGVVGQKAEWKWNPTAQTFAPNGIVTNWKETTEDWVKPQRWILIERASQWINENPNNAPAIVENLFSAIPSYAEYPYESGATGQIVLNGAPIWSRRTLDFMSGNVYSTAYENSSGNTIGLSDCYSFAGFNSASTTAWKTLDGEELGGLSLIRVYNWAGLPPDSKVPKSMIDKVSLDVDVEYVFLPPDFLQKIPPSGWTEKVQKYVVEKKGFASNAKSATFSSNFFRL